MVKKTLIGLIFFSCTINNLFADPQKWQNNQATFMKTFQEEGIDAAISYGEKAVSEVDLKKEDALSSGVSQFLYYLGALYQKKSNLEKASIYLNKSLEVTKILKVNENDPFISKVCENLGDVYASTGKKSKALENYNRALKIRETNYGVDHPSVANILIQMGKLHKNFEEYDKANENFEKALKIRAKAFGNENDKTAAVLVNIGEILIAKNDLTNAEGIFLKAMDTFSRQDVNNTFGIIFCKDNLAYIYRLQKKLVEAAAFYRQTLTLKEQFFGKDHIQVANTLNNLAAIYLDEGKAEAETLLLRALKIIESSEDKSDLPKIIENLKLYYNKVGQPEKADKIESRVKSISKGE